MEIYNDAIKSSIKKSTNLNQLPKLLEGKTFSDIFQQKINSTFASANPEFQRYRNNDFVKGKYWDSNSEEVEMEKYIKSKFRNLSIDSPQSLDAVSLKELESYLISKLKFC
jgi:hypothetical protein